MRILIISRYPCQPGCAGGSPGRRRARSTRPGAWATWWAMAQTRTNAWPGCAPCRGLSACWAITIRPCWAMLTCASSTATRAPPSPGRSRPSPRPRWNTCARWRLRPCGRFHARARLAAPAHLGILLDVDIAYHNFPYLNTPYCLVGHTHQPVIFHQVAPDGDVLDEDPDYHAPRPLARQSLIINPGSVGQPRDNNPDASCRRCSTWKPSCGTIAACPTTLPPPRTGCARRACPSGWPPGWATAGNRSAFLRTLSTARRSAYRAAHLAMEKTMHTRRV